jgi:hypothetical protein
MQKMEFRNPSFLGGLNVTVRRGPKWSEAVKIGDGLELCASYCLRPVGVGQVCGVACIPFLLIPEFWLSYEHEETCDNLRGLLQDMLEIYPGFSATETVSVILFDLQ